MWWNVRRIIDFKILEDPRVKALNLDSSKVKGFLTIYGIETQMLRHAFGETLEL